MTLRLRHTVFCLLLTLAALLVTAGGLTAAGKPTRAVSLNALTSAIKSGSSTEKANSLCGITRLCGYIPDEANDDVVLLGVVDPDLPSLHLEDLVIAMRNVWGVYDRISGRIRYYSDPGCSIDPNPAVIAQLRDYDMPVPRAATPEATTARMEGWKAIGRQPQKVRVLGIPFDCRFAKVMVDADYYMKRIVNGSVALNVDGLVSLSDLDIEARRQALRTNAKVKAGSMSRFWFSPGDSTYEVRDGATILRSCDVKLLTEAEYLTERGAIAQMGRPDPNADQFARSFSQRYSQIAAQRPIYKELKSLFSFVAIARLMKDDGLSRTASRSIGYLLRGYKVPCVPVSRAVNGLTDVRTIDEAVDTPNGKTRFALIQSSCGGVSMSVRPRRIKTASRPSISTAMVPAHKPAATATTPRASSASATPPSPAVAKTPAKAPRAKVVQAKSIKKVVLGARKSAKAMSWDVPVQLD